MEALTQSHGMVRHKKPLVVRPASYEELMRHFHWLYSAFAFLAAIAYSKSPEGGMLLVTNVIQLELDWLTPDQVRKLGAKEAHWMDTFKREKVLLLGVLFNDGCVGTFRFECYCGLSPLECYRLVMTRDKLTSAEKHRRRLAELALWQSQSPPSGCRDAHMRYITAYWDRLAVEAYTQYLSYGRGLLVANEPDFLWKPPGVDADMFLSYVATDDPDYVGLLSEKERTWVQTYDPETTLLLCILESINGFSSYRIDGKGEKTPKALYGSR